MHSIEYKILSHLHANGGKCPNSYQHTLSADESVFFDHLMKTGHITHSDGLPDGFGGMDYISIAITPDGLRAFLTEKERLDTIDDQASQNAQHKAHERTLAVAKAFLGFFKALAGLNPAKLIEYIESIR